MSGSYSEFKDSPEWMTTHQKRALFQESFWTIFRAVFDVERTSGSSDRCNEFVFEEVESDVVGKNLREILIP